MAVRNLDFIRNIPQFGAKLYESLQDIISQGGNVQQQTNANGTGQPQPPPGIDGVNVTGQNGHFNIAIKDNNPLYRDVHYYVEHASNSQFTDPHVIHLGHTRNHSVFLGNVTRFFRAYSAYPSSKSSPPQYHGGAASPTPVNGGGAIGGPSFLPSEGSGTGAAGQGLSGPGPIPFRSATGAPPVRE